LRHSYEYVRYADPSNTSDKTENSWQGCHVGNSIDQCAKAVVSLNSGTGKGDRGVTATLSAGVVAKTTENTDSHPVLATERDAVASALSALGKALKNLEPRVAEHELSTVYAVRDRALQRMQLSATHTVVALAGATGSGKSSLFNALTGMELSKVGVRRPTTDTAYACLWGPKGAADLLAWLGIQPDRQMARESVLDADEQAELRGLVLLDLPDHDSTMVQHHVEADRLVERVDMLIWVVDPQKYADAAIHERYLRALKGRDALVIVVLNQVDNLTEEETTQCLTDLQALLTADGLPQARLLATSTLRGDGMAELRICLVSAVAARVASMRRLRADLAEAGATLAQYIGPAAQIELNRNAVKATQSAVAEAVGLPVLGQQASDGYRNRARTWTAWPVFRLISWLKPTAHPPEASGGSDIVLRGSPAGIGASVHCAQVKQAARALAEDSSADLPAPWQRTVREAAQANGDRACEQLRTAVSAIPLHRTRIPGWWRLFTIAQWAMFAILLAGSAWLVAWSLSEAIGKDLGNVPTLWTNGIALPTVLVLSGLVTGPLLSLVARPAVLTGAANQRSTVEQALREATNTVCRDHLIAPIRSELTNYEDTRIALTALKTCTES
jgi:putative ribosome biogenesis GTPase RsgA